MLSIFIMLFIAIGIASGIGYAIVTLIHTANTSLTIQANQVRLQNISTAIRAGITTDGGQTLLPVSLGRNGEPLARIPAASPFSTTTTGADIVYCPVVAPEPQGASFTPNNTMTNPGTAEAIPVVVVEDFLGSGRDYVSVGFAPELADPDAQNADETSKNQADPNKARLDRMLEMGVIAYLMSPQPNYQGPTLQCSDVNIAPDNYTLLANGGSVVPVYAVSTDAKGSVFVLSDADMPPQGYNGAERVVRELKDVANFIERYQVTDATIRLPETGTTVTIEDLQAMLDASRSRTIRFIPGNGSDGVQFASANLEVTGGTDEVSFSVSGKVILENITLSGSGFDAVLQASPTGELSVVDSVIDAIETKGGRVDISGTSVISPEFALIPVRADGGTISISSDASPAINGQDAVQVFEVNSGSILLSDGLNVNAGPGVITFARLTHGGRLSMIGGSENINYNGVATSLASLTPSARTVVENCSVGSTLCEASCDAGEVVVNGGCGTGSTSSVISFGPSDADTYRCEFSSTPAPSSPSATALCGMR